MWVVGDLELDTSGQRKALEVGYMGFCHVDRTAA